MVRIIFLEEFGKAFVPKKFIPTLKSYLLKAGFNEVPYRFFGLLFYTSAFVTGAIFVFFIYPSLRKLSPLKVYLISFFGWFAIQIFFSVLFVLLVYFYLDLKIYQRTKNMEDQLPDFLQMVSSNLKGGMTFERSLWAAIKPRFSILGSEMAKASKKVMTGYEVSKALIDLSDKYDSLMLKRTVDLIISELESGGNAADIIDRIVENLKETKQLKNEMSAAAVAYIIFISTIVIFISPLLFSLAFHMLNLIVGFINKIALATAQNGTQVFFVASRSEITPSDFKIFSMIAIFVISFFSSLIVSIVEKGDVKSGVKYIPIYVFGSLIFYLFLMKIFDILFSGILR